jgi:hypothetical protein
VLWPNGEKFVPIPISMFNSEAYRTLPPRAVAVFIAMLNRYWLVSRYEKYDLRDKGFTFTWKLVEAFCAEGTFRSALKAILERGFFDTPPHLQPMLPGKPIVYAPSEIWRTWHDKSGKLQKHLKLKEGRRNRKKDRLTKFITGG